MEYTNQYQTIQQFANELVNQLKNKAPRKTGKLRNSIEAEVTDEDVKINSLDYGSYVDLGVNGTKKRQGSPFSFKKKMPPAMSFRGYGVNPFAISKSVFENGIKGTKFINNNQVENKIEDFAGDLTQAIWDDLEDNYEATQIK